MAQRFEEFPQAVRETRAIFERIDFDLTSDLGYRYPGAQDPRQARRLRAVCEERLVERYGPGGDHQGGSVGRRTVSLKEARGRLDEELRVIEKLQLPGFFLIHHDLLELAREIAVEVRGRSSAARSVLPPGRGRGSSGQLDRLLSDRPSPRRSAGGRPLPRPLPARGADLAAGHRPRLPARHPPRADPARPRALRHRHSALVAAFPTYRTRGALRDLAKVLGLPMSEIERIVRQADRSQGEEIDERVRSTLIGFALRRAAAGSRRAGRRCCKLLPQIHRCRAGSASTRAGW